MKKFRGTYMAKEEYTGWELDNLKFAVKNYMEAHYTELKEYYSERIHNHQMELVSLGYSWEEVEELEIEYMKKYA